MISNIELTITDARWPELELVLKCGPQIRKVSVRCDQAELKFKETTDQFIHTVVQMQIQRRKGNGVT